MDYKFVEFKKFINKIKKINSTSIFTNFTFKNKIINVIDNLFIKLNTTDKDYLYTLTIYTVNSISLKYNFKNTTEYYNQWEQNNNRDIKSALLLLLPFIDDKDNNYLLKNIVQLRDLLYSEKVTDLKDLFNIKRDNDNINKYFKFGNMGIGLLNKLENNINNTIYNDNMIYELIYHNFIGLLQTLEIINGKLYINWINTVPYNFNNYYNSNFYNKTQKVFAEIYNAVVSPTIEDVDDPVTNNNILEQINNNINKILNECLLNYNGLWLGDIYNILRIKYYEELKKIKWLIFPYETNTIQLYLIQGLNKMLNINSIINSDLYNYEYLIDTEKYNFENKLKNISNNLKSNITLFGNIKIDFEILKNFLIFYINNNDEICKDYYDINKWKIENDDNIYDEYEMNDYTINITTLISNITINDIINLLDYIIINNDYQNIWNYLKDILTKLKYSVLYKYLVYYNNNSKSFNINNKYYYDVFNVKLKQTKVYQTNVNNKINLKNIYNIAKYLSHGTDWTLRPDNYLSLSVLNKIDFFYHLFNLNHFLQIKNNLNKQYIDINFSYDEIKSKTNEISSAFITIILPLIFEELIAAGSLCYFTVNLNITDLTKLPSDDQALKYKRSNAIKVLFENNISDWNESYYYLTNEKYKYTNYLSNLKDSHQWITFYAMDWLSQISFFHHYIFHQILYITGATGQGKSTQVPKILLYALKVIDYKTAGKIICTVPRTVPTLDNTTTISNQIGFPILDNKKKVTNNYYIQFKHQEDEHFTNILDKYHLSLKIVTDGTLYEVIKENIIMKKKIKGDYINENIYDIIIVDEAHEHGINMDLILSLTRQTCILNNQIRLAIVSATMDNDELIYRQYYRMINDKLLYPIKTSIIEPILNNKQYIFNPIFMDRRYHISPPGGSTQYVIDEEYENNEYEEKEIIELSIKKVINICSLTNNGDILVFTNGVADIFYIIEKLNSMLMLPDNIIALPFFSSLNQKYIEIVKNGDYKSIKTKKENIHIKWKSEYLQDNIKFNYNRIVIVSTNIAEASITLNTVKFVIDNGHAKVNIYDPILDITKLSIEKISESSRIQRKGRVGRVSSGKIYYLYPKNSRKNILLKYNITQENMGPHLLKLLTDNSELKLLVDYNSHPYNYNFRSNTYNNQTNILLKILIINFHINDQIDLIEKGYYYYFNMLHYEYNLYLKDELDFKYINNDSGQLWYNMQDKSGKFFLIHYFEKKMIRNIYNDIIYFDNKKVNSNFQISNIYYVNLLHFLRTAHLIVPRYISNNNNKEYKYIENYADYTNEPSEIYIKTEIGKEIIKYSSDYPITYTIKHLLTLFYAKHINCYDSVFCLIVLIFEVLDNKYIEIINTEKNFNQSYIQFKQLYNNYKSEILLLYGIIEKIFNTLNYLDIFKLNYTTIEINLKRDITEIVDTFLKYDNQNSVPPNFSIDLWNYLKKLKSNNNLNINDLLKKLLVIKNTNIYIKTITNLNHNESKILDWCNKNILNYKVVKNFIVKIMDYKFRNMINNITLDNNYDNILKCFIFGNPTNISFYDNERKSLIPIINLLNNNVTKEIHIYNFSLINSSNYLLFYFLYEINNDNNIEIALINDIKVEWLIQLAPIIYNKSILVKYNKLQHISYDISNSWTYRNIWDDTYPILKNHTKINIKKIEKIYNYNTS